LVSLTRTTRWLVGGVALTLAGIGTAGSAFAAPAASDPYGTVRVDLDTAVVFSSEYIGGRPAGTPDRLDIQQSGASFTLVSAFSIRPGKGCAAVDEWQVRCTAGRPDRYLSVRTGGGDDIVRADTTTAMAYLYLGDGDDVAVGGSGDDIIDAGSGDDTLTGGAGDDVLSGDDGADVHNGGPGWDEVSYRFRTAPVTADLDAAVGDDGMAGEGDTIATDVEAIEGGDGDDTLTGNDGPNSLRGADGRDHLDGLGGPDDLYGDRGNDDLAGGTGDDYCDVGDDGEATTRDCERYDPNRPTG
jgi:Ca2+-binding RTX toxin-like protein